MMMLAKSMKMQINYFVRFVFLSLFLLGGLASAMAQQNVPEPLYKQHIAELTKNQMVKKYQEIRKFWPR